MSISLTLQLFIVFLGEYFRCQLPIGKSNPNKGQPCGPSWQHSWTLNWSMNNIQNNTNVQFSKKKGGFIAHISWSQLDWIQPAISLNWSASQLMEQLTTDGSIASILYPRHPLSELSGNDGRQKSFDFPN